MLFRIKTKHYNSEIKNPSKYRIGEMCFTYIAIIGSNIFSNHPKHMKHVHKDNKGLLFVIITTGTNITGGDTVFYDWVKSSDLGNRDYVLKHLHGRMIFGP